LLLDDAPAPGFHALARGTGTTVTLKNPDGRELVLTP
jgi:hypothetical protein